MPLRGFIRQREQGDTIIEVLMVLAVLGMAISISYATANRSLLSARQAQESSVAGELARGQVERIRALSSISNPVDSNYLYSRLNRPFCINDAGNVVNIVGGVIPPACKYKSSVGGHDYDTRIDYMDSTTDNFRVTISWDDVMGQGRARSTLEYRVHRQ